MRRLSLSIGMINLLMFAPRNNGGTGSNATKADAATATEVSNGNGNDAPPSVEAPAAEPEPEPESEKLTELRARLQTEWADMVTKTPGSKEALDANLAVYKTQKEIDAEILNIKKARIDAEMEEKRNARVAMFDEAVTLALTEGIDSDNFKAAREKVVTELLSRFGASAPAKRTASSDGAATPNANAAEIVEMYKGGMSHKDIEAKGFKRSTVWHAINNAKKAGLVS